MACALVAERKDELCSLENLIGLQLVIRCIGIDARDNTQITSIVNFEGKTEVARPSHSAKQDVALLLAYRTIETYLEEWMSEHCCTAAKLGVDDLLAKLEAL